MVFSGQTTEILKFRSLYRAYRTGAQVVRLEWSRTALASSRLSLLEMQARVLPGRKPVTRKRIHIDLSGSKRHQILYILGPRCAKRHQKSDLKPGRINLLRLRRASLFSCELVPNRHLKVKIHGFEPILFLN